MVCWHCASWGEHYWANCDKITCENSWTTNIQFYFKCNTFCGWYDIGQFILWRGDLNPELIWRDNGSETWMTFFMDKQKFLSKKQLQGVLCIKFVWNVFQCTDMILLRNWLELSIRYSKLAGRKLRMSHVSAKRILIWGCINTISRLMWCREKSWTGLRPLFY